MSVLDKYSKDIPDEKRTVTAPSRLEQSLFDRFQKHCQARGLTVSEAIRYLIMEALRSAEAAPINQLATNQLAEEEIAVTSTPTPKPKAPQRKTSSRPNTNQWKIGKKLPCPICGGWFPASNFARDHAKPHGYENGYAFLTAYDQQAKQMKIQLESEN